MKTPDNKLESVKEYCTRLEKAVLFQVNLRKQAEEASKNTIDLLNQKIKTQEEKLRIRDLKIKLWVEKTRHSEEQKNGLQLSKVFASIKTFVTSIFKTRS